MTPMVKQYKYFISGYLVSLALILYAYKDEIEEMFNQIKVFYL